MIFKELTMNFAITNPVHGRKTVQETGFPSIKLSIVYADLGRDDVMLYRKMSFLYTSNTQLLMTFDIRS